MFKVKIKKSSLIVKQTEALATGASKVYHVEFSFDDSWQGLTKSVIFRAGEKSASVLLDGSSCVIPWEVLTQENVGKELLIGVSGWNDDLVTLPTVWNVLEKIQQGAELGEYGLEPSPSVVSEIHKMAKNAEEKAGMAETHAQSAKEARDEALEVVNFAYNYALDAERSMEEAKEATEKASSWAGTAQAHVAAAYGEAERARSYAAQAAAHSDAARMAESSADSYALKASLSAKEASDAVAGFDARVAEKIEEANTALDEATAEKIAEIEEKASSVTEINIVQETGNSENAVMSQKATSNAVNMLRTDLEKSIGVVSETTEPEVLEIQRLDGYHYHKLSSDYTDGDGKVASQPSQCTELIAVTEGQKFYVTGQYGYNCCLIVELDESKNFIQSIVTTESGNQIATDYEYIVPNGVAYVGFSTRNATTQPLIVKGSSVTKTTLRNIGEDVNALREEVETLKETVSGLGDSTENNNPDEDVEKIKSLFTVGKNLYDPENDTFGNRADGTGSTSLNIRNSEWITLEPNTTYCFSLNYNYSVLFVFSIKNKDGTVRSSNNYLSQSGVFSFTTDEAVDSVRFSPYNSANNQYMDYVMLEKGVVPTEYEPNKLVLDYEKALPASMHNIWLGKKLVVDGDSITHDPYSFSFWQFVASKILGMWLDTNIKSADDDAENGVYGCGWKGIGGSTIADEEQAKINSGGTSTDDPLSRSILLRHQNLPDDADLVMIAAGSNDWAHSVVDLGETDSTDTTTFNGALNALLPSLKTKYPNIPVVMMTPIKRGTTHNSTNSKGYTLQQFVDAMIMKCREYGVHCLDMWGTCPINPHIPVMLEMFFKPNDSTHPNDAGHGIMGKTVAGFIRTLS